MLPINSFTKEFRKWIPIHRVVKCIFIIYGRVVVLSMILERIYFRTFIKFGSKTLKNVKLIERNVQENSFWVPALKESSLAMKISDNVLSEANKENCLKLLNSARSNEFFSSKSSNKAAVLVPLCKHNDQLAVLYTVRALHLKVNGGEIAFPGGRFDDSDGTLERTAIREAYEEVGVQPNKVNVWGKGPEIHRPDIKVTPVLAYIGQLYLEQLRINPDEVSCAFVVTLENLSSSKNFCVTRFRSGKNYVIKTPVYLANDRKIWGLTAYITHLVLSSLIPEIYKKNIKFRGNIQRVLNSHLMEKGNVPFIK